MKTPRPIPKPCASTTVSPQGAGPRPSQESTQLITSCTPSWPCLGTAMRFGKSGLSLWTK
eukprot:scaffold1739_cov242-Pinguiococcus_pyrenoidosus.AAC.2